MCTSSLIQQLLFCFLRKYLSFGAGAHVGCRKHWGKHLSWISKVEEVEPFFFFFFIKSQFALCSNFVWKVWGRQTFENFFFFSTFPRLTDVSLLWRRCEGFPPLLLSHLQKTSEDRHELHCCRGPEDSTSSRILDPEGCGSALRRQMNAAEAYVHLHFHHQRINHFKFLFYPQLLLPIHFTFLERDNRKTLCRRKCHWGTRPEAVSWLIWFDVDILHHLKMSIP